MPFKKGQSGNPSGSRNVSAARKAVTNKYIRSLREAWEQHGQKVLDKLAEDDPGKFVDVVAKVCVLPQEVNIGGTFDHKHTHEHISIQEANRRLGELLGEREAEHLAPPVSH